MGADARISFGEADDALNSVPASAITAVAGPSNSETDFATSQSGREFYRSVARLGQQVAEGLAYAHSEGILHRDIKPSNLLLDARGNAWITDFGLARDESTDGLTRSGDFVGTLRYMPPERLDGWSDRRSDIYSLGATLYELLTLRPFLETSGRGQLVDKILHDDPLSPSTSDPAIPRDLETIVLKAIAKEPALRYRTAADMGEDLTRFIADRSILARRSTPLERLRLWCRRSPAVATLTGVVAVLLVAAVAILAVSNTRIRRESAQRKLALQEKTSAVHEKEAALLLQQIATQEKDSALKLANRNEMIANGRFYNAQMNLALQAWRDEKPARAVQLLETLRPTVAETDLRGFEWYALYHALHENVVHSWRAHSSMVNSVAWSPAGDVFVSAAQDGFLRIWDGQTGEPRGEIPTGQGTIWEIAFSGDGKVIAGALASGDAAVWDVARRREIRRWAAHPVADGVRGVAVSPNGQLIATCSRGDEFEPRAVVKLWDSQGRYIAMLECPSEDCVLSVAFSPDGARLAAAGAGWDPNASLIVWDVPKSPSDDAPTKFGSIEKLGACDLRFSNDGATLWAGNAFGEDGRRPNSVIEIDVESMTVRRLHGGHTERVSAVACLGETDKVVSASEDRTIRMVETSSGASSVIGAELAMISALAVDPTGRRIASGDLNGWITLRDLDSASPIAQFAGGVSAGGRNGIDSVRFTPDGKQLYVGLWPLNVLDIRDLAVQSIGPPGAVLAISPRCDLIAVYDRKDRMEVWDTQENVKRNEFDVGDCDRATISPDGKYLATWKSYNGDVCEYLNLWDIPSGTHVRRYATTSISILDASFAPNSKHLAIASQFHRFRVFDVAAGTTIDDKRVATGLMFVGVLSYSPDGSLLAVGLGDGSVVLYAVEPQTGQVTERTRLVGHSQQIRAMTFGPDSRWLITSSNDRSMRLWDVVLGQERAAFPMLAEWLAVSPTGNQLAVVTGGGTLSILKGSDLPIARVRQTWRGANDLESPASLCQAAQAAEASGDLTGAEALLAEAIEALHNDSGAGSSAVNATLTIQCRTSLSRVFEAQGRSAEAEELRKQTLRLAETNAEAAPDSVETQRLRLALLTEQSRSQMNQLASQGLWKEAAASAQEATLLYPEDAFGWYALALLRLRLDDVAGYRECCASMSQRAESRNDDDSRRWLTWTLVLGPDSLGDLTAATENAREFAAENSAAADRESVLGGLLYRSGDYAEAAARLNIALEGLVDGPADQTSDLYAWLLLAMSEARAGDLEQARRIYADAEPEIDATLARVPPWNRRVTLEILRAEAAELLSMTPTAGIANATPTPAPTGALDRRREKLRAKRVLAALTKAVEMSPTSVELLLARARRLTEIEEFDRAAADWVKAIGLSEDDFSWNSPRKVVCRELAAIPVVFRLVADRLPDDRALWAGRCQYDILRSNWADAAKASARVFEAYPLTDDSIFEYAGSQFLAGNAHEYQAICDRLRLHCDRPHNSRESFNTARTCTLGAMAGADPDRMVELAKERVQEDDQPWNWHVLGLAYYRAGKHELAIETLQKSIAGGWGDIENTQNWLVLAMSYQRLGDSAAASKWFDRALRTIAATRSMNPKQAVAVPVPDWIEIEALSAEAATVLAVASPRN
ncbi:MAG: protein kinase [Planctomycetales bacterium]|nr:protein kinase [Planctomycetales bacterium]